jgi:alanyl-tRNA synthetase
MKNLTSHQIRALWTTFWTAKQHVALPEVSLIADKTATALFNVAGMQPLIPYLLGKPHPKGKRLFNIQKCIRTVDIAEVGDASHLTFFEMMGNRSLGDYFKKEAVAWSWEFLTQVLEIDPRKLAITVFEGEPADGDKVVAPRDEETAKYRKEVGMPTDKISYLPAEKNRRSPGPVGPCGPDTEIYYRVGSGEFPPA